MKADGICKDFVVGMMEAEPIVPLLHVGLCDHILDVEIDGGTVYRVDLTGHVLDPKLVRAVRQKELDFFASSFDVSFPISFVTNTFTHPPTHT